MRTNPANAYRNGTMYSSYTAEQLARTYDLAHRHRVNLMGAVTWAFEFEGQPYFDGFRDLSTNGIDKPVLNIFRMLGRMNGDRVAAESTAALPLDDVRDKSVRGQPDISALASRDARSVSVLIWNYHDDNVPAPDADVALTIAGLPSTAVTLTHYRVDKDHSNAYEAWLRMGSPASPTTSQRSQLERAAQLQALEPSRQIKTANGESTIRMSLPRQAVSLVTIGW
jgi:xylan 1,4-beta-xylosidase